MAYRGLSVCLLLEEFPSQSCKPGVSVGMVENLISLSVHAPEWIADKFRVFVCPGLLCSGRRSVFVGSELLESLMRLVLWQEKRNAFRSDHFLMPAAEWGGLHRVSSNSCQIYLLIFGR